MGLSTKRNAMEVPATTHWRVTNMKVEESQSRLHSVDTSSLYDSSFMYFRTRNNPMQYVDLRMYNATDKL